MTFEHFDQQLRRLAEDPIYGAGYQHGLTGLPSRRHYTFPLDRIAWADGLRDGVAEALHKGAALADWNSRSRPPRR